jgi:hypothetical protein
MHPALRGAATVALFVILAGLGYVAAQYWQGRQAIFERVAGPDDCDLRAGPCVHRVNSGRVSLSITPSSIPLMQTLTLEVTTTQLEASAVVVDIRGLNMDMGLNRTALSLSEDGVWQGETILPICSQRQMEWEAAIQLTAGSRVEVPFPFVTLRP